MKQILSLSVRNKLILCLITMLLTRLLWQNYPNFFSYFIFYIFTYSSLYYCFKIFDLKSIIIMGIGFFSNSFVILLNNGRMPVCPFMLNEYSIPYHILPSIYTVGGNLLILGDKFKGNSIGDFIIYLSLILVIVEYYKSKEEKICIGLKSS